MSAARELADWSRSEGFELALAFARSVAGEDYDGAWAVWKDLDADHRMAIALCLAQLINVSVADWDALRGFVAAVSG